MICDIILGQQKDHSIAIDYHTGTTQINGTFLDTTAEISSTNGLQTVVAVVALTIIMLRAQIQVRYVICKSKSNKIRYTEPK
jgi:hypothetical protein